MFPILFFYIFVYVYHIGRMLNNGINLVYQNQSITLICVCMWPFGILMTNSNHVFRQETFHITSDSEATLIVHITQGLMEALKAFCEKKAAVSNLILSRVVLLLGRKECLNSLCWHLAKL